MYSGEMAQSDDTVTALAASCVAADPKPLATAWRERVAGVLDKATLALPSATWMQSGGLAGRHTEHLSHLLAEMQVLQRSYPGARW
jgi:ring-1,2-phenylacetyl-CoA epoxidase subunit PaaC